MIGISVVLTQASAAWRSGRDRLIAGIAFGIGVLETVFLLALILVASFV